MEPYEFVNVELGLIDVVKSQVRVKAGVDIPNPRPDEYVQVSRVGGTSGTVADRPMVQVIVWGPSWTAAHDLAALVKRRMHAVRSLFDVPVYRVGEVGGLSRSPDPVSGSPRYQFTVELNLRGHNAP